MVINLEQIVQEINARRNHIRYPFQELAMVLTEKLGDPRHKSLYMKIAKYEEQELVMDALHYVLASPNASGNLGALFMWKLKELKERPVLPIVIRFDTEVGYFKVGVISKVTRGDMPILIAGLTEYQEMIKEKKLQIQLVKGNFITISEKIFDDLSQKLTELLKEFHRKAVISIFPHLQWSGKTELRVGQSIAGVLKLGAPVLTKRLYTGRMRSS
ncbi:hypothetical protein IT418_04185 [bacterium]|nr:hypothetical protein [bacterium]